jgi:hypothetical protein
MVGAYPKNRGCAGGFQVGKRSLEGAIYSVGCAD